MIYSRDTPFWLETLDVQSGAHVLGYLVLSKYAMWTLPQTDLCTCAWPPRPQQWSNVDIAKVRCIRPQLYSSQHRSNVDNTTVRCKCPQLYSPWLWSNVPMASVRCKCPQLYSPWLWSNVPMASVRCKCPQFSAQKQCGQRHSQVHMSSVI